MKEKEEDHSQHEKNTDFEVGEQVYVYPTNEPYFKRMDTRELHVTEVDKSGVVWVKDARGSSICCMPWRLHKSKFMERINEIYREESDVQR